MRLQSVSRRKTEDAKRIQNLFALPYPPLTKISECFEENFKPEALQSDF